MEDIVHGFFNLLLLAGSSNIAETCLTYSFSNVMKYGYAKKYAAALKNRAINANTDGPKRKFPPSIMISIRKNMPLLFRRKVLLNNCFVPQFGQ